MAHFRILLLPMLLITLAGCKLIDQTSFGADQEAGPPTQAVAAPSRPAGQAALVTIRYDQPNPAFQDPLAAAIRAAEQHRPGGGYDVIGVSTAAQSATAARDSANVMNAMIALGVTATRIHLGARIDPAQSVREIRILLRP